MYMDTSKAIIFFNTGAYILTHNIHWLAVGDYDNIDQSGTFQYRIYGISLFLFIATNILVYT